MSYRQRSELDWDRESSSPDPLQLTPTPRVHRISHPHISTSSSPADPPRKRRKTTHEKSKSDSDSAREMVRPSEKRSGTIAYDSSEDDGSLEGVARSVSEDPLSGDSENGPSGSKPIDSNRLDSEPEEVARSPIGVTGAGDAVMYDPSVNRPEGFLQGKPEDASGPSSELATHCAQPASSRSTSPSVASPPAASPRPLEARAPDYASPSPKVVESGKQPFGIDRPDGPREGPLIADGIAEEAESGLSPHLRRAGGTISRPGMEDDEEREPVIHRETQDVMSEHMEVTLPRSPFPEDHPSTTPAPLGSDLPMLPFPSSTRSASPPPAPKSKQRKPTRVGPTPKPTKGTSVRTQMNALRFAKYNSKGEIIGDAEEEEEGEEAVEEYMRERRGSIDVDGKVVVSDVMVGRELDEVVAPTEGGLGVIANMTSTHIEDPDSEEIFSLPIREPTRPLTGPGSRPRKPKTGTSGMGATRQALNMLEHARYNEKGEIIEDVEEEEVVAEVRPSKRQKKARAGGDLGMDGPGCPMDGMRPLAPLDNESTYDGSVGNETGSMIDTPDFLPVPPKRRGPGKKNKLSATISEAASSEPPTTPVKHSKKGAGKAERESSVFLEPEVTSEKGKKGGKKGSAFAASTPPRSASINSSLPEKEEAPSRRRKKKDTEAVEEEAFLEPEMEDEKIYCVCRKKFREDSSDMVECDLCQNWYHFKCMGMEETKLPLIEQYVCPRCEEDPVVTERTSWKTKCRRDACNQPDRAPLSKYCTDVCGIHETLAKLKLKGIKIDLIADAVRSAPRPGGLSVSKALSNRTDYVDLASDPRKIYFDDWKLQTDARAAAELQAHRETRTQIEGRIRLLEHQEEQLARAIAAADAMPPLIKPVDAIMENGHTGRSKPGKKGKPAAPVAVVDERPCGFDVRLIGWQPTEGGDELCRQGRKRCTRHAGWQKLRAADLELERANLTNDLDRIARRITSVRMRHADVMNVSLDSVMSCDGAAQEHVVGEVDLVEVVDGHHGTEVEME